ncbi:hypothetical protein N0V93_007904 [Gnomoniopsis smithogilvyi]|uniref:Uncharacterized protein n=1 Tax=Gnomoniopsis smithogilvyi TaxID=1191159 RepID=A0A9W9CT84_9PEZI|nr:hypothetical protein N0V93_007904 [Gnomoniopsis smithogilvyi]
MDALKNLASKAGSGGSTSNTANTNTAAGGQQEDYVDKAFDFGAKKAGHPMDRNTSEKITDGARSAYEKATGKTVSSKISN